VLVCRTLTNGAGALVRFSPPLQDASALFFLSRTKRRAQIQNLSPSSTTLEVAWGGWSVPRQGQGGRATTEPCPRFGGVQSYPMRALWILAQSICRAKRAYPQRWCSPQYLRPETVCCFPVCNDKRESRSLAGPLERVQS